MPRQVASESSNTAHQSEQEKIRVQFEFTPDALARLDALKRVTDSPTRAETLRSALRLYEWLVNEAKQDSKIMIMDGNGEITSQFPAKLLMR